MLKRLKKWWLGRKIKKLKREYKRPAWLDDSNVYIPPERAKPQAIVILDEFAKIDKGYKDVLTRLNRPESELPQECPSCGGPVTPSKIDDRVAACLPCKLMFITQGAYDDPNIQRDITHTNAGVTPRMKKMPPSTQHMSAIDIWRMRRENEINQARAFGQGWTYGRYGMSREEYNKMRRQENEDTA